MQEINNYARFIFPPVLSCFSDQDGRVRYYACEALYNIAKISRSSVLQLFDQLFDALCNVTNHNNF